MWFEQKTALAKAGYRPTEKMFSKVFFWAQGVVWLVCSFPCFTSTTYSTISWSSFLLCPHLMHVWSAELNKVSTFQSGRWHSCYLQTKWEQGKIFHRLLSRTQVAGPGKRNSELCVSVLARSVLRESTDLTFRGGASFGKALKESPWFSVHWGKPCS